VPPNPLRSLWNWSKPVVQALAGWFLITTFLVEPFRVWPTGSMKNTLLVNDFLFVNKFLYGAELPLAGARRDRRRALDRESFAQAGEAADRPAG
jgi:signal peptidase I